MVHGDILRTVLWATWLQMVPNLVGRKLCRKFGVGGMIRELQRETPENGIGPIVEARREVIAVLRCNCQICGKCKLPP